MCLVAVGLLDGCANSSAVRQGKPGDPIVVVAVQNTPTKKPPVKPAKLEARRKDEKQESGMVGILGALQGADPNDGVFGGVVGGVIGGVPGSGGFGGLGLSGVGIGGGGSGQGIGLGSLGTIGRGNGYGGLGVRGASSERPKVKIGNVVVTGPLTVDIVQRQVDERRDDMQRCHSLEYKEAGNRWGSVTLRLHIDATGHVDDVHVHETTLSSRDLENCLAHVSGAFEFPPPGANTSVTVLLPVSF